MSNEKPILKVDGVHKTYHTNDATVEVLKGIDLEVRKGEIVCIMGPSGSGKSTLLHIMSGLMTPTKGSVSFSGLDITSMSEAELTLLRRRKIGLVFQEFNLLPTLTAMENMLFPFYLDRKPAPKDAFEKLINILGLSDRRKHSPSELSGGEQQRVAFGRALITDPEIVFADEPTGNLDSVAGEKLCELLRELNRELQSTILLVTHNPSVAKWADRILFLKDGVVVESLDVQEGTDASVVLEHYMRAICTKQVQV